MAIPGQKPDLQIRGKVKTGEKRVSSRTGREYPAATDYFLCPDDPEFAKTFGEKPSQLVIELAGDDPWSSGLEWWTRNKGGNHLACYTKDGSDKPKAFRSEGYMDEDSEKVSEEKVGANRFQIVCPFRECVHFKNKDCKPMGRLTFYALSGEERVGPYQLDTKAWNSIENIERYLATSSFGLHVLSVAFQTEGDKKFPVLSIKEYENVDINTPADVGAADAILTLAAAADEGAYREGLAEYLNVTHPGWRDDQRYIDRIKEVGAEEAVKTILRGALS